MTNGKCLIKVVMSTYRLDFTLDPFPLNDQNTLMEQSRFLNLYLSHKGPARKEDILKVCEFNGLTGIDYID